MKKLFTNSAAMALLSLALVAPAADQVPATADPPAAPEDANPPPIAGEPSAPARALDQLLLDGLDNQLLEGLPTVPPAGGSGEAAAEPSELDRRLLEQLGRGEDVGAEPSDPFLAIGQRMRAAEELISRRQAAESGRVQREILDDLDRLIEQLKQQCCGGQSKNQDSARPKSAAKPGSQAGQANKPGSGENRGSSKAARDSEARVGRSESEEARLSRLRELHKQVWGHLPARLREQMQSGLDEEFLPQYERLIEQYYQRLAEQGGAD